MLHGPCGKKNGHNTCTVSKKCKYNYPWEFCNRSIQEKDGYPIYGRRNDGKMVKVTRAMLNNQWNVLDDWCLLSRYDCHINVEVCLRVQAVKYLYKYIYKGHDRVAVYIAHTNRDNMIDEIY